MRDPDRSSKGVPAESPRAWPALDGFEPAELSFEWGIWGKAHGARTDFRWLATSRGFAEIEPALGRQLYLGPEDRPIRMFALRSLDLWSAVMVAYPSPAADATGRRGFLEKQVFAWKRTPGLPSAAAALALLDRADAADASMWWTRRAEKDWSNPEARLDLPPETNESITVRPETLDAMIARGLDALANAASSERALAQLLDGLIETQSQGRLMGLPAPLPAHAVAALLLPLSRSLADQVSIAGWLPSSRVDDDALVQCWDAVVWPRALARSATSSAMPIEVQAAARALLSRDPQALPVGGLAPPASTTVDAGQRSQRDDLAKVEFEDQLMRDDWRSGTDVLIVQGAWESWRARAQLQPTGRQRTAMAWMTSPAWRDPSAPQATWSAWTSVLDDLANLDAAAVDALFAGPDGRRRWPWIPGRESAQMKRLVEKASSAPARARLRRGLETEPTLPFTLDDVLPAIASGPSRSERRESRGSDSRGKGI